MIDLPVLPRSPSCPAALVIAGASSSQQGVVCREMQMDQAADRGLAMSPKQLETAREGEGGVYLNLKSDPSTVSGFCHGDAIPVLTDEDGQGRASYTYCPTFQQARNRHLAGEHGLTDTLEPESVSMGVDVEPVDPFAGLQELAPNADVSRVAPADPVTVMRALDEQHERRRSVWR